MSLARAAYRALTLEADDNNNNNNSNGSESFATTVALLDDPLSAVDAHVSKQLVNECIGTAGLNIKQEGAGNKGSALLSRCVRVLVTHQLHVLSRCDRVVGA